MILYCNDTINKNQHQQELAPKYADNIVSAVKYNQHGSVLRVFQLLRGIVHPVSD